MTFFENIPQIVKTRIITGDEGANGVSSGLEGDGVR